MRRWVIGGWACKQENRVSRRPRPDVVDVVHPSMAASQPDPSSLARAATHSTLVCDRAVGYRLPQ